MSERLELLSGKAFADAITPAEAAELAGLLEPSAFLDEARIHALLPLALEDSGERFERSLRARARAGNDSARFLRTLRRRRVRSAGTRVALVAAALLIAFAGALLVASTRRPAPPAVAAPAPEAPPPHRLVGPVPPPLPPPAPPDDHARIEEEMRRQIERDRPKPAPEKPATPPAPRDTVAALAVVESVEGDVPGARAGDAWMERGVLATGPGGRATLRYPDGTRVTLREGTSIRESGAGAKGLAVERGTVEADVAAQAAGRPMVFASAHGRATVLGTMLRFSVDAASARLEVSKGLVRLGRPDGAEVEVPARCFAVAAPGRPLAVESPDARTLVFQDGPGYAGTRDTTLTERAGQRPQGSAPMLRVDGNLAESTDDQAALLKWELAGLPAGATILSAAIEIWAEDPGQSYELRKLRRSWTEASATWTSPWEKAGASGPLDRDEEPLGRLAPRAAGLHAAPLNPAGLRVMREWAADPASNHGFIASNGERQDGFAFHSRESRTPERRPRLRVVFLPP